MKWQISSQKKEGKNSNPRRICPTEKSKLLSIIKRKPSSTARRKDTTQTRTCSISWHDTNRPSSFATVCNAKNKRFTTVCFSEATVTTCQLNWLRHSLLLEQIHQIKISIEKSYPLPHYTLKVIRLKQKTHHIYQPFSFHFDRESSNHIQNRFVNICKIHNIYKKITKKSCSSLFFHFLHFLVCLFVYIDTALYLLWVKVCMVWQSHMFLEWSPKAWAVD